MTTTATALAPARGLVKQITRAELSQLCKTYAPELKLAGVVDPNGKPIDGARLLFALAGRESSFGANLTPRHEPGYDVGGYYFRHSDQVRDGITKYGSPFACSYGPLQVMACNCAGFTPEQLAADPDAAFRAAVAYLNHWCFDHWHCKTLAAICDAWNTGNPRDASVPTDYIAHVERYYAQENL